MRREPVELKELEAAAFEFQRQLERVAYELCERHDIHGIARTVRSINSVHAALRDAIRMVSK